MIIQTVFACGAILYSTVMRRGWIMDYMYELAPIALKSVGSKKLLSKTVMK